MRFFLFFGLLATLSFGVAHASKYPYFASVGAHKVNVRSGPGLDYPILWVYTHKTVPVEILAMSGSWYRIRDYEGGEGWIQQNLLKGRPRYVMTLQGESLLSQPRVDSAVVATMDRGVIARILKCTLQFCKITAGGRTGYVPKPMLWGVYINETIP